MNNGPVAITVPSWSAQPQLTHGAAARDQAAGLRSMLEPPADRGSFVTGDEPRHPAPMHIVSISSGKGGVGKTNVAVNLAIALQACGVRTTLVDMDEGLANADLICGLNPLVRVDRVAHENARLTELTVLAPGGFALVPGSVAIRQSERENPGASPLDRLGELAPTTDVLLIDTGAGIGSGVLSAMSAAQLHVVVTTPEPTALADAYALVKVARGQLGARFTPGLVINQCQDPLEGALTHARISGVAERFLGRPLNLLGEIPSDPAVAQSVRDRRPFALSATGSPATAGIRRLAAQVVHILGVQHKRPQHVETVGGVLGRLAWLLGGSVGRRMDRAARSAAV